ncbi:MAG: site-specific integrase [Bacteroidota bacterium]
MKIKAILWDHRPLADKTFPIKIRITIGSKVKYFPVNASATVKQWDAKSQRVKVDTKDNAAAINEKIREMLNAIESNYLKGETLNPIPPTDDFYKHFQDRIDYTKAKHSFGHYKRLKTVLQKMKEFRSEARIQDINHDFLKAFELFLLKRGNCENTIYENFVRVKTVVKELVRSGRMEYHKNPFLNFKVDKKRVERVRLTIDQIQALESVVLKKDQEIKARDMYMFSFYCAGVRFGDMCRLNKSNFIDGRLVYTMHKTNKERSLKLMPQALEIIKRYNYTFNIKDTFNSISSANASLNGFLKDIAKPLNIPPISFHTSRHSFTDYAIKNGVDIHTIKDMLGHATVTMTEVYAKSFYTEKTDEAMDKLFPKK